MDLLNNKERAFVEHTGHQIRLVRKQRESK